jgi:hypothetical protein
LNSQVRPLHPLSLSPSLPLSLSSPNRLSIGYIASLLSRPTATLTFNDYSASSSSRSVTLKNIKYKGVKVQCLGLFPTADDDGTTEKTRQQIAAADDASAPKRSTDANHTAKSPSSSSSFSASVTPAAAAAAATSAAAPLKDLLGEQARVGGFALRVDAATRAVCKNVVMVGAGTGVTVGVRFTPPALPTPDAAPQPERCMLRFSIARSGSAGAARLSGPRIIDVLLQARPPRVAPVLPPSLDVGLAAVGSMAYALLPLHNPTPRPITWRLNVPTPFDAAPAEGELAPGQRIETVVAFAPDDARAYVGDAVLRYDAGPQYLGAIPVELRARSQYPYVSVVPDETMPSLAGTPVPSMGDASVEPVLDFGRVPIGRRVTRTVVLRNVSDVTAELEVEHSFLSVSHVQLTGHARAIPAGGSITVRALYCPEDLHERCVERFAFCVKNGNRVVVHCQGSAVTPKVGGRGGGWQLSSPK